MRKHISLPLDIPDVEIVKTVTNAQGAYIITVKSTQRGAQCRRCGRELSQLHGYADAIQLRHLPVFGQVVYIRIRPKRYRCPYCQGHPTTTQRLSWYSPRSGCTHAYEDHILLQLVNSTVQDVSHKEALSYERIAGILARKVQTHVAWDTLDSLEVVGIDEIARRKGHRDFLALVTAHLREGRTVILAVLPDRKKATVKAFLDSIPPRLRQTIQTVCTDMWPGYVNAVYESFDPDPACQVEVVVDRFHVTKEFRAGADRLRKQELKRLKRELAPAEYQELKGTMWPFRKAPAALQPDEQQRLAQLFAHAPQLQQAYTLREQLAAIFAADITPETAILRLTAWCSQVIASQLTCFDAFLTTLTNWFTEITNYFQQRYSSGFVEGFNNKVKVLKRRCYGLLNVAHIFQRLFLDTEGYRRFAPKHH